MDFFGLGKLWTALIVVGALGVALGGAYWYVNNSAFNRGKQEGIVEVTKQMTDAIKAQGQATLKDKEQLKTQPKIELDREAWQNCMDAAAGTPEICGPKP